MAHPWDVPDHAWDRHFWDDDADEDLSNIVGAEAGDILADLLITLKQSGVITAKQACVIAHWSSQAGSLGLVRQLAYRPDDQSSGHYSRHFDRVAGTVLAESDAFYNIRMPSTQRFMATRQVVAIPTIPIHEVLDREFATIGFARMHELLAESKASGRLPQSYYDHPAVVEAGDEPCYPIAFYLDGTPFVRRDSVLGLWAYCTLTDQHHVIGVLRKSELCSCGCKGWCSLWEFFDSMRWSIAAMRSGTWPVHRHDGAAFEEGETTRSAMAGRPLKWRGAIIFVKGDWTDMCHSLGFTSWAHNRFPCFLCDATQRSLYDLQNLSPVTFPHRLHRFADYEAKYQACEIWATLSPRYAIRVRGALHFDKRKKGSSGRALSMDVCGLMKGDRLEPDPLFRDIGQDPPANNPVLFWRTKNELGVKHRNPLFHSSTGIDPSRCIALDTLHSLSLGVFQDFLGFLLRAMIHDFNVWEVGGAAELRCSISAARLQAELFEWYRTESKAGRNHSRVQNFAATMLGNYQKPTRSLHGAETNGMLEFSVHLIARHASRFPGHQAWSAAALTLVRLKNIVKEFPHRPPPSAIQEPS